MHFNKWLSAFSSKGIACPSVIQTSVTDQHFLILTIAFCKITIGKTLQQGNTGDRNGLQRESYECPLNRSKSITVAIYGYPNVALI